MGIHQFMDMVDTGTWIAAIGAYPEYLILGMNSYTQLSLLRTRIVYYFISEKKKKKKKSILFPKSCEEINNCWHEAYVWIDAGPI